MQCSRWTSHARCASLWMRRSAVSGGGGGTWLLLRLGGGHGGRGHGHTLEAGIGQRRTAQLQQFLSSERHRSEEGMTSVRTP